MFRRELSSQHKSHLGNKGLKALRQSLSHYLQNYDSSRLDQLFSGSWYRLSQATPKAVIYFKESEPLFFESQTVGSVCPTLYLFFQFPEFLPAFVIHPGASRFVIGGADVMLPSVIKPTSTECYGGLEMNKIMSVRVHGNPFPFAVGFCMIIEENFNTTKGKVLKVTHRYGDGLWNLGSKTCPNSGFTDTAISPLKNMVYVEDPKWYFDIDITGNADDTQTTHLDHQDSISSENESKQPLKNPTEDRPDILEENDTEEKIMHEKPIDQLIDELSPQEVCEKPHVDSLSEQEEDEEEEEEEEPVDKVVVETPHKVSSLPVPADASQHSTEFKEEFGFLFTLLTIYTLQRENNLTLPIPVSGFFSKMMTLVPEVRNHPCTRKFLFELFPSCDDSVLNDPNAWVLRKTSFKSLSKLIQFCSKAGIMTIKKMRAEDSIIAVNRQSEMVQKFRYDDIEPASDSTASAKQATSNTSKHNDNDGTNFNFVVCYKSKSQGTSAILDALSPDIQQMYYTTKRCEEAFYQYIDMNQLESMNKPNSIVLDGNMLQFCVPKADRKKMTDYDTSEGLFLDSHEALTKFFAALQVYHGIKKLGDTKMKFYKDELKPIEITVETRQRKRFVTIIKNTHSYNIDEKNFMELLQKTLASSASSQLIPGTTKKCILVQGSFSSEVKRILMQQFGLPAKFITVITAPV